MSNPRLTPEQIENLFRPLFQSTLQTLNKLSNGNSDLLFALRRKLAKDLNYQERSGPNERRRLKREKRKEQKDLCQNCKTQLPARYCVLDRIEAKKGYTQSNTRLLCPDCDRKIQEERNFS